MTFPRDCISIRQWMTTLATIVELYMSCHFALPPVQVILCKHHMIFHKGLHLPQIIIVVHVAPTCLHNEEFRRNVLIDCVRWTCPFCNLHLQCGSCYTNENHFVNFTGATFALATHVYTSMHNSRLHQQVCRGT